MALPRKKICTQGHFSIACIHIKESAVAQCLRIVSLEHTCSVKASIAKSPLLVLGSVPLVLPLNWSHYVPNHWWLLNVCLVSCCICNALKTWSGSWNRVLAPRPVLHRDLSNHKMTQPGPNSTRVPSGIVSFGEGCTSTWRTCAQALPLKPRSCSHA